MTLGTSSAPRIPNNCIKEVILLLKKAPTLPPIGQASECIPRSVTDYMLGLLILNKSPYVSQSSLVVLGKTSLWVSGLIFCVISYTTLPLKKDLVLVN